MNVLKNWPRATVLFMAAVLTGCMGTTGYRGPGNPVDFPYHESAYDLQMGWKPVSSGNDLHIEGVVRNVRFFQVRDLDVTVYLYDRNGILKAKGGDLPLPVPVAQGDGAGFDATLGTVTMSPGDRLEFKIIYHDIDGDRGGDMKVRYFSAPAPPRP
jgi:hypothetical protein